MKTILAIMLLSGCTTIHHPNGTQAFQTLGSVKRVQVGADGAVEAEQISSPLGDGIRALNQAMLGALFL